MIFKVFKISANPLSSTTRPLFLSSKPLQSAMQPTTPHSQFHSPSPRQPGLLLALLLHRLQHLQMAKCGVRCSPQHFRVEAAWLGLA